MIFAVRLEATDPIPLLTLLLDTGIIGFDIIVALLTTTTGEQWPSDEHDTTSVAVSGDADLGAFNGD